ncbi:MAG: ATP-binding protein [Deltaproteobacteria bacterium]
MSRFVWQSPDGTPHHADVDAGMTIGRDDGCTIVVADRSISRLHARIVRGADGRLILEDNNSSYGVYVGGERRREVPLADGARIRLGETTLTFEGAVPVATPTADFPREDDIDDVVSLRRSYEMLRATYELTRAIGVEHDLDRMLERILDTAFDLLSAERGSIALFEKGTTQVARRAARSRKGDATDPISQTIFEEVARTRRGLIVADAATDLRFSRSQSICATGVHSAMYVPLIYEDHVRGVFHVDSRVATNVFTETDLALFTTIANHAALCVEAMTVREEVSRVQDAERQRLASTLEALPIGVALLGPTRNLIHANPSAQRAFELLGVDPAVPLEKLEAWSLDEIIAMSAHGPVDVHAPPGVHAIFQVVAFEHAAETIVALTDVTIVRDRAAQAATTERLALVGQLSGGIAHDFNNFLAVIRSNVELLVEDVGTPGQTADIMGELEVIDQAAQRGARLTKQLLTFSRQRSGTPSAIEVQGVMSGLRPILDRAAPKHTVNIACPEDLPAIWLDPTQLEQILMNLVVNARDASKEGTAIDVSAAADDGGVALRVSDRGSGMPQSVIDHIFEPFFTTKEVGRGTGLGLATVHGIVKEAGGHVQINSTVGAGTTFVVWFPATSATLQRAG